MKNSLTITVFYEGSFWVAIFERQSCEGYSVARVVLGNEPTDPELYNILLNECSEPPYSKPAKEQPVIIKKKNPKKLQREVIKLQEKGSNMSKAYESIRIGMEQNKKMKKQESKHEKEEEERRKFLLKQQKKKNKIKGH